MVESIIFFSIVLLIHPILGFDCFNLVQSNLCLELSSQGCSWDGFSCSGTFSPSCIPPNCYYIGNIATSTTQTGTAANPLPTLTDGFTKLSGKVGTLIIINPIPETIVKISTTAVITATSNITVKPLFGENKYIIDCPNLQSTKGISGLFNVRGSLKIISAIFKDAYYGFKETIAFIIKKTLILEKVDIVNIFANFHFQVDGAIYFQEGGFNGSTIDFEINANGLASFKNVKFLHFYELFIPVKSNLVMENCYFSEGKIFDGFTLFSRSQTSIINCTFESLLISSLLSAEDVQSLNISNSIFKNLTAFETGHEDGAIKLQKNSQDLSPFHVIENCSFSDITVLTTFILLDGSGVELNLLNVSMSNVMLKEFDLSMLTETMASNLIKWQGGLCCRAHNDAILQIEFSSFFNIGSNCLRLENSQLSIRYTTFDNSQQNKQIPVVNHDMVNELDENSGTTWISLQGTSDPFPDGNQIILVGNKFRQNAKVPLYGGAVRFHQSFIGKAFFAFNEFTGNSAFYGGAIYSQSPLLTLEMSGNLFSNNSAYDGGSLYKASPETEGEQLNASVILYNNTFTQNSAFRNGGGMFLNWESLWAQDNTFVSNQAENGGAIYFLNLAEKNNQKFGWLSNTSFIENNASNVGSAIKLSFDYSQLNEDKNYPTILQKDGDSKKKAIVGGNPTYYLLSFFDIRIEDTPDETFDTLKSWVNNHEFTRLAFSINTSQGMSEQEHIKHKSGNPSSQILRVQIFDEHHQVTDYVNDGQISLQIIKSQNSISNFSAVIVPSPIYFTFDHSEIYARNTLKMMGQPGTTATLQLMTIKTNSNFLINAKSLQTYNLTVEFVLCEVGDIFNNKSKTCDMCPSGSYSLDDPYENNTICQKCPSRMNCLGGNKIAIESGYWRYDTSQTKTVRCEENSICKGGLVNGVYYPHGFCSFPNQGNMCNECPSKYAKFGSSNVCVDCEKDVGYHIKAICFFILQIIIITYMFRLTGNSERLSIMKILVNFVQMNSLIIQYNLNWPSYLFDPVKIANTIIPVGKDGFSVDCLIVLNSSNRLNNYLIRLFVTFFQPVIIWILIMLLNSLLNFKKRHLLRKERMNLFLIISFVIQTNIILTCFEIFRCQNLSDSQNPKYFMATNPSVECWTRTHLGWALGIALPLFLIWGVLLPFAVFIKARKNLQTKNSFSFLCEGLKGKLWYWEFVLLIRKTLIIFVFTVLKFTSLKLQIIISFTIFLIVSLATLKLNPYVDAKLNQLESLCTSTLTLMVYVGFFFFSESTNQATSILLVTIALILNFTIYLLATFYLIQSYFPKKTKSKQPSSQKEDMIPKPSEIQSGLEILTSDVNFILNSENNILSMQKEDINSPMSQSPDLDESSLDYDKFSPVLEKSQKIDNFSILKNSGFSNFSPRTSLQKIQSNPSNLFREPSIPSARDHLLMTSPPGTLIESPRDDLTLRESNRLLPRRITAKDGSIINLFKADNPMTASRLETLIESPRDHIMLTSPRETLSEFPQDDLTKRESTKLLKKSIQKTSSVVNRDKAEKM